MKHYVLLSIIQAYVAPTVNRKDQLAFSPTNSRSEITKLDCGNMFTQSQAPLCSPGQRIGELSMMGITWKECLPSPSLGLQAALGPLIPGDGWTVSRLARQLHWVDTCTGSGWLCRSTSHWSRRPALLGLTIPTVECHLPLVWAHFGLIRPTVFGPKLKQRTFTGPRIFLIIIFLCSYPPSPNCLVMRTVCRLYMVFYIN